MLTSRKVLKVFGLSVLAGSVFLAGCASKGYVKKQMALVDNKVTTLAPQVQENSERIDAVDARAKQGITDAAAARSAASAAQQTATNADLAAASARTAATAAQTSADAANQGVQVATARAASAESKANLAASSADNYQGGATATVTFRSGRSDLTDDAKRALDEIVGPITCSTAYRVEIMGFASSEGSETGNVSLSEARSESVQRYLVSKGASLSRISIVGLGTDNPVGDNSTKTGREQNRRAEIRVLMPPK